MSPIDVVISGIGGRFPKSRNIKEFGDNLLSGESLLTTIDRWPAGLLNTPKLAGLTDDLNRFDYTFFGMHFDLCKRTDAQTRATIETAFEALIDAGVNPTTIRGSNAHVYTATLQSDLIMDDKADSGKRSGYLIIGKNRSMSANRLSYFFDLSGHSCAYDASGGWLGAGLALARQAIQRGECDTAFVTASSALQMPEITKQKQNMGLLSPDSTCRPFSIDANGVSQGEAQVTFLVQRADIAKRSYGSIVLAGAESRLSLPNWFLSLDQDHFQTYVSSLYHNNGIDPNHVKLLEADGLAIKDMIEVELNVLDTVLNGRRPENSPLYVGTVKTFTGDTEGAAGHTALTKLILAMETGVISPTLDCKNLNPNLRGIAEGRLKLITEPTKWDVTPDTHVAVSSLSTTGIVSHVVLKANGKTKRKVDKNESTFPYLLLMSGRSESYVYDSLNTVASSPFDPEYLRLTQEVFALSIDKFEWKGYGFHDELEGFVVQRENWRPVWFVYSGMGSQWPTMGKDLMAIPIIYDTFKRLHKVLEPKGIDLMNILTTPNAEIFDYILNSFVGIAAVQIALTNVLRALGIVPDGIIGHSVGEMGCSYADGCLTEEQTILASYERGLASVQAKLIPGLMAAVGLGYKQLKDLLPPDVYVACHNSRDNCTISGPTESVEKVIASLKEKGVFVRGVNVSNIAYHSPYIQPVAPVLFESLRKVIPSPKLRSSKWICTSAPKEKWGSDEVRFCSADYHTNNLLGEVLFEEGCTFIPDNALLIEIAPHGLLQAILKRSFSNNVAHVPLTRRTANSPCKFLLEAIGKLFLEGQSPKIWRLYPDVEMPVSRSTPSLAPLVKWEHNEVFPTLDVTRTVAGQFSRCLLNNYCPSIEIAGNKCYPASHALVQAYNCFSELIGAEINAPQVIFDDVRFYDVVRFDDKEIAEVVVMMYPSTGAFSVTRNDVQVMSGRIRALDKYEFSNGVHPNAEGLIENSLASDDIYSELTSRGVVVPNKLRNIQEIDIRNRDWVAKMSSDSDCASLINSFIILFQLGNKNVSKKPAAVSRIKQLIIDPSSKNNDNIEARLHLPTGTLFYPGFSMSGVEFRTVNAKVSLQPLAVQFVPFGETGLEGEIEFLSSVLQLSSEKRWQGSATITICDIDSKLTSIVDQLQDLLKSSFATTAVPKKADLIVCGPTSIDAMAPILSSCNNLLLTRCTRSDRNELKDGLRRCGLDVIAESSAKASSDCLMAICSILPPIQPSDCKIIKMKSHDVLPASLENTEYRFIIFVWENGTFLPIEKILSEAITMCCADKLRLVIMMTPNAPPFSLSHPMYADQLRFNVPLNVYLDGKWGNYRLLPIAKLHQVVQNGQGKFVLQPNMVLHTRNAGIVKLDQTRIKVHDVFDQNRQQLSSKKVIEYSTKSSDHPRIVGVGTMETESNYVVPDTTLYWTVPEEWCSGNAAPMLFSYAMAYFILFEKAQIPTNKTILITCPLTSIGQAIIRIANSLNCEVISLVSSEEEKQQVRHLFPKMNASIIVSSSDTFGCILKKEYPAGVDLIVSDLTGDRLIACTQCISDFGAIVQVGEDAMLTPDDIGMNFFVKNAAVYGAPPQALLNALPEVKRQVQQWVAEGLQSGFIEPESKRSTVKLNGFSENEKRALHDRNNYNKINGHNGTEWLHNGYSVSKTTEIRRNSAVIIDGSKSQWIQLAYSFALKGCQLIALKQAHPSPNLISRHSKILRQEFGVELRDVTNVRSGAELMEYDLGNLSYIIIFENLKLAEDIVRELDARKLKEVQFIFFSKHSGLFTRSCERWTRTGLKVRAALGIEDKPICKAVLDWLLSPSASTVSVLDQQAFVGRKVDLSSFTESGMLPTSQFELQALGAVIRKHNLPIFEEIATCGKNLRYVGEVKPLFFIKGVHETADSELETLALGLLAPLVGITLHAHCGSLEATSAAVVEGILRIQKTGPFNLAGDALRSDVVIKVARLLESKGCAAVVFLMNEKITEMRETLETFRKGGSLGEVLLKTLLSDSIEQQTWHALSIGNMEWSEQVEITVSSIPSVSEEHKEDVAAALHHIHATVQHILGSQGEAVLEHGIVRLLRNGNAYREYQLTDRSFEYTIPATKLKRKELADFFSSNLATPVLQLRFDREERTINCNN